MCGNEHSNKLLRQRQLTAMEIKVGREMTRRTVAGIAAPDTPPPPASCVAGITGTMGAAGAGDCDEYRSARSNRRYFASSACSTCCRPCTRNTERAHAHTDTQQPAQRVDRQREETVYNDRRAVQRTHQRGVYDSPRLVVRHGVAHDQLHVRLEFVERLVVSLRTTPPPATQHHRDEMHDESDKHTVTTLRAHLRNTLPRTFFVFSFRFFVMVDRSIGFLMAVE